MLSIFKFQKIPMFPSSALETVCEGMETCHPLLVLDKEIQGNPLDLKRFWVTQGCLHLLSQLYLETLESKEGEGEPGCCLLKVNDQTTYGLHPQRALGSSVF